MSDDLITLEQKKQLQIDAGIPHLPTDLTYECRMAISGEGERGWEWQDKPHRLVYDLSRQVEADADRIEQLEREMDALQDRLDTANKARADANFRANEKQFKLAKAVEMGNKMAKSIKGNYYIPNVVAEWNAVLAELEAE